MIRLFCSSEGFEKPYIYSIEIHEKGLFLRRSTSSYTAHLINRAKRKRSEDSIVVYHVYI